MTQPTLRPFDRIRISGIEPRERQVLAAEADDRADEELRRVRRAAAARTDDEWNELYDAACRG